MLGWTGVILIVSSIPGPLAPPPPLPFADKLAHAAEFAVLGALFRRAWRGEMGDASSGRGLIYAVAGGTVVGALDEVYQTFVPGRLSTMGDVGADMVGAFIGAWLWPRLRRH